ncbi:transmembrane protein 39A isoform X2 [Anthonomus grandis grandis]|uniref:transmembrane protein 39A isoform X2 n=1 Tax=Anthonomus grandis grandis TaxID=2921223 RepID=UPI00216566F2|nr:transmembrane protein 39A isoform X2 [Anthonomus grandis grandis]
MRSGARRLSRGGRSGGSVAQNEPAVPLKGISGFPMFEAPSLPKHFPFPTIVMDTDAFYEYVMACFTIFGLVVQLMHLYRSVWWLPNSYMPLAMNFYLIDQHLILLIALILLRRVYYMTGSKIISKMYSHKNPEDLSFLSRSMLSMFYAAIIGILATIVLGDRSKMDIVYLFYPISIYIPMFGMQIRPFFEIRAWCSNGIPPLHACNTSPADVRLECEHLKTNFLDKLRQIFFTATMNAYYASFIPCCFAQPELVYDRWWNIELGFFIFASGLVQTYCQLMPLRYCDVLHRAVLHSGMWEKLDGEKNLSSGKYEFAVTYEWREDVVWPRGAVVKYNKFMWRAVGDCNAIVPGDRALSWGYRF